MSWQRPTRALAVGALLALALAAEHRLAETEQDALAEESFRPTSVSSPRSEPVSPFTLPLPEDFSAIAERPLFLSTRRPPEPLPPELEPEPLPETRPAPNFVLLAVVRDGARRIALIASGPDQEAEQFEVGDAVVGWKLTDIARESVLLSYGKEETQLFMRVRHH